MYQTKQKKTLTDFLKNNTSRQFSINEIISAVCPDGSGKSTVYRQISKFVDDGTLLRMHGDDGKNIVYQYAGAEIKCSEHFHLKCTVCGELIHLNCDRFTEMSAHILTEHKFVLDTKKTVLYGVCSSCNK